MYSSVFGPLARSTAAHPERDLYVFYDRRGRVADCLTYADFDRVTEGLAASLRHDHHIAYGDRVALAFGPGTEFISAFVACAKIGAIPVPLPMVAKAMAGNADPRAHRIVEDCAAAAIIADGRHRDEFEIAGNSPKSCRVIAYGDLSTNDVLAEPTPNEILFLQYTSGSTSSPRGVVVTHANVLHNAFAAAPEALTTLSWLPHYHDMGLIGYLLTPLIRGGTAHNFAPMDFVRRPALWFELMTATGATHSSAPNFAFDTCLREDRIPGATVSKYRLDRITTLMSGAEPVRPDTMERFFNKFAPAGLRREALIAAYGLAENTLCVSTNGVDRVDACRDSFEYGREIVEAAGDAPSVRMQSCGKPIDGVDLRIVDPETHCEMPEGRFGEIWLDGPSKTQGYWNNDDLTAARFHRRIIGLDGEFFSTGDIGALHDGEVYVQGRIGEMVVSGGANFFPEDVEQALTEALRRIGVTGLSVAAFADRHADRPETFIAVIESRARQPIPLLAPLHAKMSDLTSAPVATLAVVGHGVISRTTSGKLARYRIREAWQQQRVDPIERYDVPPHEIETPEAETVLSIATRLEALGGNPRIADLNLASIELVELSVALERLWDSSGDGEEKIPEAFFDLGAIGSVRLADIEGLVEYANDEATLRAHLLDLLARLTRELRDDDGVLMREDTRMADTLSLPAAAERPTVPLRLFTGATGFLGSFLIASMLEKTGDAIIALARAKGGCSARQRVFDALSQTGIFAKIPAAEVEKRLTVLPSDLGADRLELSPTDWSYVADNVTDIYHSGAEVDYVKDYRGLRKPNVIGTAAILDLCATGKRKFLHHMSSTMIYGWEYHVTAGEDDFNAQMRELDFGYSQSKWVSEQMVLRAIDRGLDGRIYRPAFLTASRGASYVRGDIIARLVGYMIRHRVAPDVANQISLIPVDIAANNIVAISLDRDAREIALNIVTDDYSRFGDIARIIEDNFGYGFDYLTLRQFVDHTNRNCRPDDDFYPLRSFMNFHHQKVERMSKKIYDSRRYQALRDATPATLADATLDETVTRIVEFLLDDSAVPKPRLQDTAVG